MSSSRIVRPILHPIRGMLPLQIALGHVIRRRRKGKGLPQDAFALEAGLDRTYQTSIEMGRRNLTLRMLERIARSLGIEVSVLLGEAERERCGIHKDRDAHDAEMARLREESKDRYERMLAGYAATRLRAEAIQLELEKIRLKSPLV